MRKPARRSVKKENQKFFFILCALLIAAVCALILVLRTRSRINLTPEMKAYLSYDKVQKNDDKVDGCNYVKFDAYFLKDTNNDGTAEGIRGTCKQTGDEDILYIDLSTEFEGYLKDATISINSNNFYYNTAIVKDNSISENYISPNTETIRIKRLDNGNQLLLSGKVRSGDYSNSHTYIDALNNNINACSQINSIVLNGTYVAENGVESSISKEVFFVVDWYNTPEAKIPEMYKGNKNNINQNYTSAGIFDEGNETIHLKFNVVTEEIKNRQNLKSANISGTIPKLNGYAPISVKITDSFNDNGVVYTYNDNTRNYTAKREAKTDENGNIETQAYNGLDGIERYNEFLFDVEYPRHAYDNNMSLLIPVELYYEAYNNTNNGFENPNKSNVVNESFNITFTQNGGGDIETEVFVGQRVDNPFNGEYVVGKFIPEQIYNYNIAADDADDDIYPVTWVLSKGTEGTLDGIMLKEPKISDADTETLDDLDYDQFMLQDKMTVASSMTGFVLNRGIYFSGAGLLLENDGYIRVYDEDSGVLLHEFSSTDWNSYNEDTPYMFNNPVEHIRVETSGTDNLASIIITSLKQINDKVLTTNIDKAQFDTFKYISSSVSTYIKNNNQDYTLLNNSNGIGMYESAVSVVDCLAEPNAIGTNDTYNVKLMVNTYSRTQYEEKWKDGTFILKFPSEVSDVKVNSIISNDNNVSVLGYEVIEIENSKVLKIITGNDTPSSYTLTIDANITPNFDINSIQNNTQIELYASNSIGNKYVNVNSDIYDVNGNSNNTEVVGYSNIEFLIAPSSSISSYQVATLDGNQEGIIAPRVARTEKGTREARVDIKLKNNYDNSISDVVIQGVIPFENNTFVGSDIDMGSTYSTTMKNTGISIPEGVAAYAKVYYSTESKPSKELADPNNGWKIASQIDDWSAVKSFLIDLGNYEIQSGNSSTLTFSYDIVIPEGIEYNEISYSSHSVYFALNTDAGKYYRTINATKLGFMIAKQFNLEIIKMQQDSDNTVQGVTYSIEDKETGEKRIQTTDVNGALVIEALCAEKEYSITEIKTTDNYILDSTSIQLYTYMDENEILHAVYKGTNGSYEELDSHYTGLVRAARVIKHEGEDYKVQLEIDNQVKGKLKITKTDGSNLLSNIRFALTGNGINATLTTNGAGAIEYTNLNVGKEYMLSEENADGYYLNNNVIKFKIVNNDGNYTLNVSGNDNNSYDILLSDENGIPTVNVNLGNDKIPTYSLRINDYAKGTDERLKGAQYRLFGDGISTNGTLCVVDENGTVTVNNLYEFVNGRNTGSNEAIYTLKEIYAPAGYTTMGEDVTFRATRNSSNELEIAIISGEDSIRNVGTETDVERDVVVLNSTSDNPTVQIGVEDIPNFVVHKEDEENNPLQGASFEVYSIDDVGQETLATTVDGTDAVGTTDSTGSLTFGLGKGKYKIVETEAPEHYELPEDEEKRTHYFGIDESQNEESEYRVEWVNSVISDGWNSAYDVTPTRDGGVVAVGYLYTAADFKVNKNSSIAKTVISHGEKDAYIVKYDNLGNLQWVNVVGGAGDEEFKRVIELSDGKFAVIGTYCSEAIKSLYSDSEGTENESIVSINGAKGQDAMIMLVSPSGTIRKSISVSGNVEDNITSIVEDGSNIVVVGNFYSETLTALGTSISKTLYFGNQNSYIASFTKNLSICNWMTLIGGNGEIQASDIAVDSDSYAVAVNYYGQFQIDNNTIIETPKSSGAGSSNEPKVPWGSIVWYRKDGAFENTYYALTSPTNNRRRSFINGVTKLKNGNILAYGSFTQKLDIGNDGTYELSSSSAKGSDLNPDGYMIQFSGKIYDPDKSTAVVALSASEVNVKKVIETKDQGFLITGRCSTGSEGIDINNDGTADNTEVARGGLDAFIAKTDSTYTPSGVYKIWTDSHFINLPAAAELEDGGFVFAGSTSDAYSIGFQYSTNPNMAETVNGYPYNDSGFITKYNLNITSPQVNDLEEITINNELEKYNISIANSTENGAGGKVVIDDLDEELTTEPIDIEKVKYNDNSTRTIKIVPDESYQIISIKINGESYVFTPDSVDGSVTIDSFENVDEDKHIFVLFSSNASMVEINHVLWNGDEASSSEKIAATEYLRGEIGKNYQSAPKQDVEYNNKKYVLITNGDYYEGKTELDIRTEFGIASLSEIGYSSFEEFMQDYYVPREASSTYDANTKFVNYYYKEKTYSITTRYLVFGTNKVLKDENGIDIEYNIQDGFHAGDTYTTSEPLSVDNDYELVEIPINATGTISENATVVYYYKLKAPANVIIHNYNIKDSSSLTQDIILPRQGVETSIGDSYIPTESNNTYSADVPKNYRLATVGEVKERFGTDYGVGIPISINVNDEDDYIPQNYTGNYSSSVIDVIYYYKYVEPKVVKNNVVKTADKIKLADSDISKVVTYTITYEIEIKDFVGTASAEIVDNLEYEIDPNTARLDGGIYDANTKTITWRYALDMDTYEDPNTGKALLSKTFSIEYIDIPSNATRVTNTASARTILGENVTDVANSVYNLELLHSNSLKVVKEWKDGNIEDIYSPAAMGLIPNSINVRLKATNSDGVDKTSEIPEELREVTLNNIVGEENGNNWTYIWSSLDKFDGDGKKLTYSIEESDLPGNLAHVYTSEVQDVTSDEDDATLYKITNTYNVPTEKIQYTITKNWEDNNNASDKRPDNLVIKINKVIGQDKIEVSNYTLTNQKAINVENTETLEFAKKTFELLKYDEYGNSIQYEAIEDVANSGDLKFYTQSASNGTSINSADSNVFNGSITNTFSVPTDKIQIKVTNTWNDNNNSWNKRPGRLMIKAIGGTGNNEYNLSSANAIDGNTWSYTFTNLDKYDSFGNEINYSIIEAGATGGDVSCYVGEVGDLTPIDEISYEVLIKNNFTVPSEKIVIKASKIWNEENDAQRSKRPASIKLILKKLVGTEKVEIASKIVDASSNWTVDKFDTIDGTGGFSRYDGNGNNAQYFIDEEEVNEGDLKFYTRSGEVEAISQGNSLAGSVTNTFAVPDERVTRKYILIWDDESGRDRLSNINAIIRGGGMEQSHTLTSENATPSNPNEWEYEFTDLAKYDANGDEIIYTFDEAGTNESDLSKYIKTVNGNRITNKLVLRTTSITKDGTNKIFGKDDEITYTFNYTGEVAKEYSGEIRITINDVLPYDTIKTDNLAGGLYDAESKTITWEGMYNTTTNEVSWLGGTKEKLNEQTDDNKYIINLSKTFSVRFDADSLIALYEANKDTENGANLVNNINAETRLVSNQFEIATNSFNTKVEYGKVFVVNKEWKGDSQSISSRPALAHVVLKQGENLLREEDLSGANSFEVRWTGLPKYDSNGSEIDYLVDEPTVPEGYYKEVTLRGIEGNKYYYEVSNNKFGSITIIKVDGKDNSIKLAGAEFELTKLKQDPNNDSKWIVDDSFEAVKQTTSSEEENKGKVVFSGLKYGKYRLMETKAPTGYNLLRNTVDITITDTNPNYESEISNREVTALPVTGKASSVIIVSVGLLLIVGALKYKKITINLGKPKRRQKEARISKFKQNRGKNYKNEINDLDELDKTVYFGYEIDDKEFFKKREKIYQEEHLKNKKKSK